MSLTYEHDLVKLNCNEFCITFDKDTFLNAFNADSKIKIIFSTDELKKKYTSIKNRSNCSLCKKEFSLKTLKKYGDNLCNKCYNAKNDLGISPADSLNNSGSSEMKFPNSSETKFLKRTSNINNDLWDLYKDDPYCFVCRGELTRTTFEAAHVVSQYAGGNYSLSNLRITCRQCNRECGTKNLYEYMFQKRGLYIIKNDTLTRYTNEYINEVYKEVIKTEFNYCNKLCYNEGRVYKCINGGFEINKKIYLI